MAGDIDWDAYRLKAGQEAGSLNTMPFVFNPTTMSSDPTANTQALYGQGDNSGGIVKAIDQAFTDYYGRPAKSDDVQAWLAQAQTSGLGADAIRALIQQSTKDPRVAAAIEAAKSGASGATPASPFSAGLMSGNALSGGLSFNNGLMGR